ncbi:MAG: hypothetical protein HKO53_07925, partial [Gemmatimonadetes bacterium]|nr:hypothetical protein [Gemmatimonadota bacterium]
LLDEDVFRAIAGFPLGLFAPGASGVEPAHWFPEFRRSPVGGDGGLEPLRIPAAAPKASFEAARLSAVSSLAGWVGGRMGEVGARGLLASVYDALARANDSGALVVVDPGPAYEGDPGSWIRNVILLVWLSLPLVDRYGTFFSSDGTGSAFAEPLLVGKSGKRGEHAAGRSTLTASPGAPAAPRFVDWAGCVMGGATALGPVSKRADVRGQSLLSGRVPVVLPRPLPSTPRALVAWVEKELAGPARGGAVGIVVARCLSRSSSHEQLRALEGLSGVRELMEVRRFADGVVRGLGRDPGGLLDTTRGAQFVVEVGTRSARRGQGLDLAVRGLQALIEAGGGTAELRSLVERASTEDGAETGAELWRLGLGLLRRAGRYDALPSHVALLGRVPGAAAVPGVACDLAELMGEGWRVADPAAPGDSHPDWLTALATLWLTLAETGADPCRTDLHRLAWQERRRFGCTGLASLPVSSSSRRFVRGFMDGDPALPVFLDLRRSPLFAGTEGETFG